MKKWLRLFVLGSLAIGGLVLIIFAKKAQNSTELESPEIIIHVSDENNFLTEEEMKLRLKRNGFIGNGLTHEKLNSAKIEKFVRQMSEVKDVKVFSNIGKKWTVEVTLRKPIVRIFNAYGESFYLDQDGEIMKTSQIYTAKVVVATGAIKDRIFGKSVSEIINNDSLKTIRNLDDLYRISNYVCNDPFLRSLIGQIHLEKNGDFVIIPMIGDHKIIFGTAKTDEDVHEKFNKLMVFYKEAIPYEGWNKYETINLKYKNQIVGKKKEGYEEQINKQQ
ncbi:MAG: hypothetical protein V4638_10030 [Bacteroidota bacterium]